MVPPLSGATARQGLVHMSLLLTTAEATLVARQRVSTTTETREVGAGSRTSIYPVYDVVEGRYWPIGTIDTSDHVLTGDPEASRNGIYPLSQVAAEHEVQVADVSVAVVQQLREDMFGIFPNVVGASAEDQQAFAKRKVRRFYAQLASETAPAWADKIPNIKTNSRVHNMNQGSKTPTTKGYTLEELARNSYGDARFFLLTRQDVEHVTDIARMESVYALNVNSKQSASFREPTSETSSVGLDPYYRLQVMEVKLADFVTNFEASEKYEVCTEFERPAGAAQDTSPFGARVVQTSSGNSYQEYSSAAKEDDVDELRKIWKEWKTSLREDVGSLNMTVVPPAVTAAALIAPFPRLRLVNSNSNRLPAFAADDVPKETMVETERRFVDARGWSVARDVPLSFGLLPKNVLDAAVEEPGQGREGAQLFASLLPQIGDPLVPYVRALVVAAQRDALLRLLKERLQPPDAKAPRERQLSTEAVFGKIYGFAEEKKKVDRMDTTGSVLLEILRDQDRVAKDKLHNSKNAPQAAAGATTSAASFLAWRPNPELDEREKRRGGERNQQQAAVMSSSSAITFLQEDSLAAALTGTSSSFDSLLEAERQGMEAQLDAAFPRQAGGTAPELEVALNLRDQNVLSRAAPHLYTLLHYHRLMQTSEREAEKQLVNGEDLASYRDSFLPGVGGEAKGLQPMEVLDARSETVFGQKGKPKDFRDELQDKVGRITIGPQKTHFHESILATFKMVRNETYAGSEQPASEDIRQLFRHLDEYVQFFESESSGSLPREEEVEVGDIDHFTKHGDPASSKALWWNGGVVGRLPYLPRNAIQSRAECKQFLLVDVLSQPNKSGMQNMLKGRAKDLSVAERHAEANAVETSVVCLLVAQNHASLRARNEKARASRNVADWVAKRDAALASVLFDAALVLDAQKDRAGMARRLLRKLVGRNARKLLDARRKTDSPAMRVGILSAFYELEEHAKHALKLAYADAEKAFLGNEGTRKAVSSSDIEKQRALISFILAGDLHAWVTAQRDVLHKIVFLLRCVTSDERFFAHKFSAELLFFSQETYAQHGEGAGVSSAPPAPVFYKWVDAFAQEQAGFDGPVRSARATFFYASEHYYGTKWSAVRYMFLGQDAKGMKTAFGAPALAPSALPSNACASVLNSAKVYFVRHGESTWNAWVNEPKNLWGVARELAKTVRKEYSLGGAESVFLDAPLTKEGIEQAKEEHVRLFERPINETSDQSHSQLGDNIPPLTPFQREILQQFRDDVRGGDSAFFVSPLRRAISTMLGVFQEGEMKGRKAVILGELQEIAPNVDAQSLTPAFTIPTAPISEAEDKITGMRYKTSLDASEYIGSKAENESLRKGKDRILAFTQKLMGRFHPELVGSGSASGTRTAIVTGHSIWFRNFFNLYLNPQNEDPKRTALQDEGGPTTPFAQRGRQCKIKNSRVVGFVLEQCQMQIDAQTEASRGETETFFRVKPDSLVEVGANMSEPGRRGSIEDSCIEKLEKKKAKEEARQGDEVE